MNTTKRVLILLFAMILSISMTACDAVSNGGSVKVGVRESVPGFGYKNPKSGTYAGMEIELSNMLAESMGYSKVEFIGVTAETREKAILNGDVDFIVATYTITEERKKEFDFSLPYYNNYLRVMVQNSSMFKSTADLKNKTIGVSKGSTAALYLAKEMANEKLIEEFDEKSFNPNNFKGGINFKVMNTYPDLDKALEQGDIDAVCTDKSILMGYLTEERSLLPEAFEEQGFGVCMKKESKVSEKIQIQIEKWAKDGTLDALHEKWDLN